MSQQPQQPVGPPVNLHQLLKAMIEKGASDLHITTGSPPQLRIDGDLVPLRVPQLSPVDTKQLCYSILTDAQKHKFEEENELDLSFGVKSLARFRCNLFMQRGAVAAAFRTIPFKILSFQELGLPPVVAEIANRPRGLVLVTGPTGSGKSTNRPFSGTEHHRPRDEILNRCSGKIRRIKRSFRNRGVAGCVNEFGVLLVGHRVDINQECIDENRMNRTFLVVVRVRSEPTGTARNFDHAGHDVSPDIVRLTGNRTGVSPSTG